MAIKGGLILLIIGINLGVWHLVQKRMVERQLQSESPENEQASFLMDYFLPVFQVEPDQVAQVERLEQQHGVNYFLSGTRKFVRGLRLIPLILGNKHHPAGLSCEIYGLSPAGQRTVEVHIHRCVAGVRLAELHEDETNHAIGTQRKPSPDGGGGLLATAKVSGLGARVHFDAAGRVDEFRVLDEDMTVFLKIERIPDSQVLTPEDVHARMVATAKSVSRENIGQMSVESRVITAVLNTHFLKRYYHDLKDMALGLIQQNILAGLTGPMGVGNATVQRAEAESVAIPQDQLRPDSVGAGLPQSVAQAFGYGQAVTPPVAAAPPDEAPTRSLQRYLAEPSADVRQLWVEEGRSNPGEILEQFLDVVTNTTDPAFNQELVAMLLEINTVNSDKVLSYLLGGTNDLGFRQLSRPLLERTLQSLVALKDLSEPAADVLVRAWLDRERPEEFRQAIVDRFDDLDFHGQRVIAHVLKRKIQDSRESVFERVDSLTMLGQLPFNQDNVEILEPFLTDRHAVIQKAAIRAMAGYGDAGYERLRDMLSAPGTLLAESVRQEVLDALMKTGTRGARLISEMSRSNQPLAVQATQRHENDLRKRFAAAQGFEEKSSVLYDAAQVGATLFLTDVVKMTQEDREVRKRAFLIFNYPDIYRFHDELDAQRVWHYLAILDLNEPFFNREIQATVMPESKHEVLRAAKHPEYRIEHFRNMWRLARKDLIKMLAGDNAYLKTLGEQRLAHLNVTWKTLVDEIFLTTTPQTCVLDESRYINKSDQEEWAYAYTYLERMAGGNTEDAQIAREYLPVLRAIQTCVQNQSARDGAMGLEFQSIQEVQEVIVSIETQLRNRGLL